MRLDRFQTRAATRSRANGGRNGFFHDRRPGRSSSAARICTIEAERDLDRGACRLVGRFVGVGGKRDFFDLAGVLLPGSVASRNEAASCSSDLLRVRSSSASSTSPMRSSGTRKLDNPGPVEIGDSEQCLPARLFTGRAREQLLHVPGQHGAGQRAAQYQLGFLGGRSFADSSSWSIALWFLLPRQSTDF